MKKIYAIIALLGTMILGACSDFLDETTDKSGSAYIYHMDQLYGLMGSIDLYLFNNIDSDTGEGSSSGAYLTEALPLSDAVELSPEFYVYGLLSGEPTTYEAYCWQGETLMTSDWMIWTWTPVWERIYRFNTVLEYLDEVVQTTAAVHDQVEGEARFGRAYYHFMLLTQYCLWDEDKPGIGYRDNAKAGEIPGRETVGYTLEHIYEDLRLAEEALTRAGRTTFDQMRNFRPTVPTVQAFRARVALYRGDYELALANATEALKAHHVLVDFKNEPEYELEEWSWISVLDEEGEPVDEIVISSMFELDDMDVEAVAKYEELYLPNVSWEGLGGTCPISKSFYELWDRENDARWIYFYSSCTPLLMAYANLVELDPETWTEYITYENWQRLKPWNLYSYSRFAGNSLIGMTTAEMYLIKAECEARSGNTGEAAETLRTLRYTRFMDEASAEAGVTGSVQDVLDERLREMGAFWRFFDVKRLNGAEDAGIYVRREILTNPVDLNTRTVLEIAPDDPRWALPFYTFEAEMMGWEQNAGWE
ncbi:RagB/SusD family nutrient uptake outer membrane protein [Butyricimonas paravirosa]|uniref:RagB/SusD family nutrient uptake outer membrane protein n=1 Tax=Butyricimonas paravirosa TaxID=1472417 RepID=UPI002A813830|nr:RagB/SusD family nutrient uptake outer membrane protein [Butyricimonas paravirosa]